MIQQEKQIAEIEINGKLFEPKINDAEAPEIKNEVEQKVNKKEEIQIGDFAKIEFKVGEILESHEVEGADKLYRFIVDVGEESGPRTILSGIREFFPDKNIFIGKKVCVVANLAPRKMRGYESNGMLLFAGGDSGKLYSVSPDADTPNGTIIR